MLSAWSPAAVLFLGGSGDVRWQGLAGGRTSSLEAYTLKAISVPQSLLPGCYDDC